MPYLDEKDMGLKVVFIASLYHSGMTLLHLLLGKNPMVVGLGEIYLVLKQGPEPTCSYGRLAGNCIFWGDTLQKMNLLPRNDLRKRFALVLDNFQKRIWFGMHAGQYFEGGGCAKAHS